MTTNQEGKHVSFRAISGTSGTYNGDAIACFKAEGATANDYNSAFIQWLQIRTGSSQGDLNGLQSLFAIQQGFDSWGDVNTFPSSSSVEDVYVLAVHSNGVGRGTIADAQPYLSGAISGANIWNGSEFAQLNVGSNNEGNNASSFGPEAALGYFIGQQETINIVKKGVNSSYLHNDGSTTLSWNKDISGGLYSELLTEISAASVKTMKGLVIFLGGNDRNGTRAPDVQNNIDDFITQFIADHSGKLHASFKVMVIGLVPYDTPNGFEDDVMSGLIAGVADANASNPTITTTLQYIYDHAVGADGVHLDWEGQTDLGESLARQYLTIPTTDYFTFADFIADPNEVFSTIVTDTGEVTSVVGNGVTFNNAGLTGPDLITDGIESGKDSFRYAGAEVLAGANNTDINYLPTEKHEFHVLHKISGGTTGTLFSKRDSTAGNANWHSFVSGNDLNYSVGNGAASVTEEAIADGTTQVTYGVNDTTNKRQFVRGRPDIASGTPGAGTNAFKPTLGVRWQVGDTSIGFPLTGDIGFFVTWSGNLTRIQRRRLNVYYAANWTLSNGAVEDYGTLAMNLDSTDASSLTLDGADVTTWADQTANSNDAAGTTKPSYSATAVQGLPGVTFVSDGSTTWENLVITDSTSLNWATQNLIGVCTFATDNGNQFRILQKWGAGQLEFIWNYRGDQSPDDISMGYSEDGTTTAFGSPNLPLSYPGRPQFIDAHHDGANPDFAINIAEDTATVAEGVNNGTTNITLGAVSGSAYEFTYHQFLFYSAELTDIERSKVFDILIETWKRT